MQKFFDSLAEMNRERMLVYGSLMISMMLVALRILYTESFNNLYLVWNVFLAWLPYIFSNRLLLLQGQGTGFVKKAGWFVLWLLFIPNSAYILTDFIHLEPGSFMFWFDILMIFSMAFIGIFLGSLSFYNVHTVLLHYLKREHIWPVLISLNLLTGFGIYVGRFWRWNSWDVFTIPHILLNDLADAVFRSSEIKNILFFTVAYGMFQFFIYMMVYVIKGRIYVLTPQEQTFPKSKMVQLPVK